MATSPSRTDHSNGRLEDAVSGLNLAQGELTMLVAATPAEAAALADRLGRLVPQDDASLDGVPLEDLRSARSAAASSSANRSPPCSPGRFGPH